MRAPSDKGGGGGRGEGDSTGLFTGEGLGRFVSAIKILLR
jgi:hypothetical protein